MIGFGVAFLLFMAVAWLAGGFLIRPAKRNIRAPDDLQMESVSIESDSGATLAGWYLPNTDKAATVLLFHPVRGNRTSMLGRAKMLHDAGFAVTMIDFQAHGESSGEQIAFGFLEKHDVQATIEFAKAKDPTHEIGIVGWSLGGAATLLAQSGNIDAVVLESVYPTIKEAVANRLAMRIGWLQKVISPVLLWQLPHRLGIGPDDLRPIDSVARLECPVLIMAGDQDHHTTLAETNRLFEAANEPKELVIFQGASHEDLFKYDPQKYEQKVVEFLSGILK